jgi:hypothetical protein
MSYQAILTGLQTQLKTVVGIRAVLDYVPTSVQTAPLIYSVLDSAEIVRSGQVRAVRYRILHRLCVRWQDNERAEWEIIPLVDAIPAAIEADPHLGGVLTAGYAEINEIEAAWVTIGGIEYRVLDFYSTVIEK